MTPPLFLLADIPSGDEFLLSGDEGYHAARVRRVGADERVYIADGRGLLLDCVVASVRADGLLLRVVRRELVPEPQPRLVAVQALPKGERAELAVEVLTELGADEIVPWAAERSIVQWRGERGERSLAKWRRTAAEAAKQSRRARIPRLGGLCTTADIAELLGRTAAGLVLHESADEPLSRVALPLVGDVMVIVGPEGGVAPDELAAFTAAGAVPVRLGEVVLRTSTAGAAALAALSLRLRRWD